MHGVQTLVTRVERQGIAATHVRFAGAAEYGHRHWSDIRAAIEASKLEGRPRELAFSVFRRLADAEAAVHGIEPELVHLHELGGDDTLLDVCGVGLLLDSLGVEHVVCSPVPYTRGRVQSAHGTIPTPAPATLELLRGALVSGAEGEIETVTPTGAAIVVTLADSWGEMPHLAVEQVGYGAGTADPAEWPNVLRAVIGTDIHGAPREVVLLETNIDDLLPELLPDAVDKCFEVGALDVWLAPVQMKKGRLGFTLSALARPADEAAVVRAMLTETTSLGVRASRLRRWELERGEATVAVAGGTVRVKLAMLDGRVVNVAPEHDDCADLASRVGRPVKSIWAEALAAAQSLAR